MPLSSLSVARAVLERARLDGIPLSNRKLQDLAYLAHGLYEGRFGDRLIQEEVRAWSHGPVVPELSARLSRWGAAKILPFDELCAEGAPIDPGSREDAAIAAAWEAYKGKTAAQLDNIVCSYGGPWAQCFQGGRHFGSIQDAELERHFKGVW